MTKLTSGQRSWQTRMKRVGKKQALEVARSTGSTGGKQSTTLFKPGSERARELGRKGGKKGSKKTVHKPL